jgi:hypothetical protein
MVMGMMIRLLDYRLLGYVFVFVCVLNVIMGLTEV